MYKRTYLVALVVLMVVLAVIARPAAQSMATMPVPQPPVAQAAGVNLLPNGNFDQSWFYWRPTNHFVANMWYEWWVGGEIPEFIDGGHPHHNSCYPPAVGLCADNNNHSQGYIRYGVPFVAGVYQPVSAVACTTYRFTAYNRNDATNYHPKVGIDPTGWRPTEPHEGTANNCPPDGQQPCPDPSLDENNPFPAALIWSPEFDHAAYTWAGQSVTAEARSSAITVWTYVAPSTSGSMSAYWDNASLEQVPPANGKLIADGALPAPDGSITNVTTQTTAIRARLSWTTNQPAVTQVLYHYVGDAAMPSPPPPATQTADYEGIGSINYNSSTTHAASLPNLRPMSLYDYVILARRVVGNSCQTAVYIGRLTTTDSLLVAGPLPAPTGITGPIILPASDYAYVIWQSAQPSYGQVLYHYDVYTPTGYANTVYLPIVMNAQGTYYGSTSDYEFRTPPDLSLTTLHVITITTNLMPDSPYAVAAVSAWSEGSVDKAAASVRTPFRTKPTTLARHTSLGADQLIEQLQACLASGQSLEVCVEQVR